MNDRDRKFFILLARMVLRLAQKEIGWAATQRAANAEEGLVNCFFALAPVLG